MTSILIVDDEKNIRLMAGTVLKNAGYDVATAANVEEAKLAVQKSAHHLLLVDYMLPGEDGIALIKHVRQELTEPPPMILMTAYGTIDVAVQAMRTGAVDYISKPFTSDELLHLVKRNLRAEQLEREVSDLRTRVAAIERADHAGIVAESPAMKQVLATASQVARSKAPVLIEGETGTGKELLARYIHELSDRSANAFVAVNCGALHPELLLSELFGHRRGAFTGAIEDRIGRFEAADGGTLFLDEVGELDEAAQVKLLRVLQDGTFERVGEGRQIHVDVRIVAATNRRLEDMVAEGSFRSDLYYRLAVIPIALPALRTRVEDLMPLANAFLREFAAEAARPNLEWGTNARQVLASMAWPGNIRELRNAVQRAVLLTPPDSPVVALQSLPLSPALSPSPGAAELGFLADAEAANWSIDEMEREYMRRLLSREDLKIGDVCNILKIDPATLYRKRKRYGL